MRAPTAVAAALLCVLAHTSEAADPRPAPPFRLRGVAGEKLILEELIKKGPVLLDFWATWCKPCIAALPEIQAVYADYAARGLTVIGVSLDGPRNYSKVRPFAKKMGLGYPIALDEDGGMQERYQVRAMPTTVLIDPSGNVVRVVQGYRHGEIDLMRKEIEALLPGAAADSAATDSTQSEP